MRYPPAESTDWFHLLGLSELGFECAFFFFRLLTFIDVLYHAAHSDNASLVYNYITDGPDTFQFFFLGYQPCFKIEFLGFFNGTLHSIGNYLLIFGMIILDCLAKIRLAAIFQFMNPKCFLGPGQCIVQQIYFPPSHFGSSRDFFMALFAFLQLIICFPQIIKKPGVFQGNSDLGKQKIQ